MVDYKISDTQLGVISDILVDLQSDLEYYRDSARWDELECFDLISSITKVGLVPADEETPALIQTSLDKLSQISPLIDALPLCAEPEEEGDRCQDLIDAIENINTLPGNVSTIVELQFNTHLPDISTNISNSETNIINAIGNINFPEGKDDEILIRISQTRTELLQARTGINDILDWINNFSQNQGKDDEILQRIQDTRTELLEARTDLKDILAWINQFSFDPVCDKIDDINGLIGELNIGVSFESVLNQLESIQVDLSSLDVEVDLSSEFDSLSSQISNLNVDVDFSSITSNLNALSLQLTGLQSTLLNEIQSIDIDSTEFEQINTFLEQLSLNISSQFTDLGEQLSVVSTKIKGDEILNQLDSTGEQITLIQNTLNSFSPSLSEQLDLLNQLQQLLVSLGDSVTQIQDSVNELEDDPTDLTNVEECLEAIKQKLEADFSGEISRSCGDEEPSTYPYQGEGLSGIVAQINALSQSLSDTSAEICKIDTDPVVVFPSDRYAESNLQRQLCLKFIPEAEKDTYNSKTSSWNLAVPRPNDDLTWDDISPLTYTRGNIRGRIWFEEIDSWAGGFFSGEEEAIVFLNRLASLSSLSLKYPEPRITKPGKNNRDIAVTAVIPWTARIVTFDDKGKPVEVEAIKRQ